MVLLPKYEREDRAIERFLEYYNQASCTLYEIERWLDRPPQNRHDQQGPIPDCVCVDPSSGDEMVIECTMLTGVRDLQLAEGAKKFLGEVRTQLSSKLPGVFLLHDWGVDAIRFTAKNREQKMALFCQEILAVAPKLAEGEVTPLSGPFPVKLRKEEASRVKVDREKWLRKSEQGDKWNRCLIEGMIVLSETGARDEQTTPP